MVKTAGAAIGVGVDTTSVYWSDWGSGATGTISKCLLPDCVGSPVVMANGQNRPNDIVTTNTTIYWDSYSAGAVTSCTLGSLGTTGQPVATGQTGGILAMLLAASNVYWLVSSQGASGAIHYCPLTGCNSSSPPSLLEGLNKPAGLAADANSIFWAANGSQQIFKCALPDCKGGPTVVTSGQGSVSHLAVDATRLYWTMGGLTAADGSLASCVLPACSSIEVLASKLSYPSTIALSAAAVFANTDGNVVMLAKP